MRRHVVGAHPAQHRRATPSGKPIQSESTESSKIPASLHDLTLGFVDWCRWQNVDMEPWFERVINSAFVCGATVDEAKAVVEFDKSQLMDVRALTKKIIEHHKKHAKGPKVDWSEYPDYKLNPVTGEYELDLRKYR